MRCVYSETARDSLGNVVGGATVRVYLAGTTTPATFYQYSSSTAATTGVTTGSDGVFTLYVDRFDYDSDQKFKIIISRGTTSITYDNVSMDRVVTGTYTISANKTVSTHITIPKGVIYSVASGKTLTFSGSLSAGPYQIFSGSGTVTGLKESYPEWFGAISDYSAGTGTNSHTAIEAAAAATAANGTLIFAGGTGFSTTSEVYVKAGINVRMDVPLYYTGSSNVTCLKVGLPDVNNNNVSLKLNVQKAVQSDWTSNDSIGIKLYNNYRSDISIFNATNFTVGVMFIGSGTGFVYNTINLFSILDNKYGAVLTNETSTGIGWANENLFLGGSFAVTTGTNTATSRYGVQITSVDGTYVNNNNNVFIKPSFELNYDDCVGGAEAVPVLIEYGIINTVYQARNEDNSTTFARISGASNRNTIGCGYGSCYIEQTGTYAGNVTESMSYNSLDASRGILIFDSGNLYETVTGYNTTKLSVPGITISNSTNATMEISNTGLLPHPTYLEVPSTRGLAVYVDTTTVKNFVLVKDSTTNYGGRVKIRCYDANGTVLTSAGAGHPYVKGSMSIPSYATNFGGIYTQGSDSDGNFFFSVGTDVKKIAVMLTGGTANLYIRRFQLYAMYSGTGYGKLVPPAVYTGYEKSYEGARQAGASPTLYAFLYGVGSVIENAEPASGQPAGWVCINRVDTTMKVAAAGTDINIDVVSTTGMTAGDIVTILLNDGTYHNTTIDTVTDGDTLLLTDAMPSAASIGNAVYTVLFAAKPNL